MQAPSIDLDKLGREIVEAEGRLEEQASIVQVSDGAGERWGSRAACMRRPLRWMHRV